MTAADHNLTGTPVDVTVGCIDTEHCALCVVLSDGTPLCMGENSNGELGDGTTNDRFKLAAVTGLPNRTVGITLSNSGDALVHVSGLMTTITSYDSGGCTRFAFAARLSAFSRHPVESGPGVSEQVQIRVGIPEAKMFISLKIEH